MTSPSDRKLVDWFFRFKRFVKGLHDKAIDVAAPISPAPEPEPPHWSSLPEGHVKMLASLVCECGEAKQVGHYFCLSCREPKKR